MCESCGKYFCWLAQWTSPTPLFQSSLHPGDYKSEAPVHPPSPFRPSYTRLSSCQAQTPSRDGPGGVDTEVSVFICEHCRGCVCISEQSQWASDVNFIVQAKTEKPRSQWRWNEGGCYLCPPVFGTEAERRFSLEGELCDVFWDSIQEAQCGVFIPSHSKVFIRI